MEGLEREEPEGILSKNGIIARGTTTHAATLRTALRKACTIGKRGGWGCDSVNGSSVGGTGRGSDAAADDDREGLLGGGKNGYQRT